MSEIIRISNFGGIKEMEMELKPINVIIGPQASGKSVTAKLLYFFKSFFNEIYKSILNGETKRELDNRQAAKFITYFPVESWPEKAFKIEYIIENTLFSIEKKAGRSVSFIYPESIKKIIEKARNSYKDEIANTKDYHEDFRNIRTARNRFHYIFYNSIKKKVSENIFLEQLFIPAGRSFFANIQSSIFSFLSNNQSLDPFIIEFGSFYENYKQYGLLYDDGKKNTKIGPGFNYIISQILNGRHIRDKEKDFLVHEDKRKVNLLNASSGQQEILPLVISLKALIEDKPKQVGSTIYIEEPEAHIFPVAQKRIVQLLARTFNTSGSNFQIVVTTHSPYILSSLNNLMEAGKILLEKEGMEEELTGIIPKQEIIFPDDVAAYSLVNGVKTDLIDPSTKLISQNILDSVSDEISIEFGKLLDLEF